MISQANVVAELEGSLSPREAAKVLGMTVAGLRVMRCKGRGPAFIKDGIRVWYPKARLDEWRQKRVRLVIPEERVA